MHIKGIGSKSRAFINHKPFHPGNFKNVEAVWQAEENVRQHERKARENAQIRADEAKVEALKGQLRQFEASGTIKNQSVHGLDWMYQNPADEERINDQEKVLLGKVQATPETQWRIQEDKKKRDGKKTSGPALGESQDVDEAMRSALGYNVDEDRLRKLREDPLFVIKLAEQKSRETMMANPYTRTHLMEKEDKDRRERLMQTEQGRALVGMEKEITEYKEKIKSIEEEIEDLRRDKRRTEEEAARQSRRRRNQMTAQERTEKLAEMQGSAVKREDDMKTRATTVKQEARDEDRREQERIFRKFTSPEP